MLPAENDLQSLRQQLDQLRAEEVHAYARLKAHSDFMDQVDRADPSLVRRLAAAQLHVVPASDRPVLLATSEASPVTQWIDGTVKSDIRPSKAASISTLSRLANGPYRLWLFGGGIMAVFLGLLMSPGPSRASKLRWPTMLAALLTGESAKTKSAIVESKFVELPDDAMSLEAALDESANEMQKASSDEVPTASEPQALQPAPADSASQAEPTIAEVEIPVASVAVEADSPMIGRDVVPAAFLEEKVADAAVTDGAGAIESDDELERHAPDPSET